MTHLADRNLRRRGGLRRVWHDDGGFSLLEMFLIATIASVMMAMAIMGLGSSMSSARSRGAIAQVKLQLQNARELAISQQRDIQVEFVEPDTIKITRINLPTTDPVTVLSQVRLEGSMQFKRLDGVPETPDAWGDNPGPIAFGTTTKALYFRSGDGALVNQSYAHVSGRVFVGHIGGKKESFGVVSIFGPTGRIRSYRLTGGAWHSY